jgi:hypothetical protein
VTPSHKQQSVPSFHDSVLGCWQFHEAELLMEKDSLNWSKERLWSRAQKWDEEIVEWTWKRNRMKERDEIGENPMFGWPYRIQSIFGRDEEWRKTLFIDKVILDCIQTDIGCVKHVKTKSNLKKQQEWVSEWVSVGNAAKYIKQDIYSLLTSNCANWIVVSWHQWLRTNIYIYITFLMIQKSFHSFNWYTLIFPFSILNKK